MTGDGDEEDEEEMMEGVVMLVRNESKA